jgi:hypothetical protein
MSTWVRLYPLRVPRLHQAIRIRASGRLALVLHLSTQREELVLFKSTVHLLPRVLGFRLIRSAPCGGS